MKPLDPVTPFSRPLRLRGLAPSLTHTISETATEEECRATADALGLLGLRKLRLSGRLAPHEKAGWELTTDLGATVTQACVLTLVPVTTRVETRVVRRYSPDLAPLPDGAELGPEDDLETEPLPEILDLGGVAIEALALAMPDYPRADGAELPESAYEKETDAHREGPFAALVSLSKKISDEEP
ncbi:MAG: DUF177 domain-containing protein [Pseudomonadota bacterium]